MLPRLIRAQFEQACGLVETLSQASPGADPFFVAVSVPAGQLSDRAVVDDVVEILDRTGIDPSLLMVELNDLTSLSGRYGIKTAVTALRAEGVRITLGQFGGRASSMRDLRELPFTDVTIDSSFIDAIDESSEDLAMVTGLVSLAQALGMTCAADGVADADQASALLRLGCDLGRGGFWGAAAPESELQAVLRKLSRPLAVLRKIV